MNTQISKAVMTTAFEPVQSIVYTNLPDTRIKNHAFLYFIITLGMHYKLAKKLIRIIEKTNLDKLDTPCNQYPSLLVTHTQQQKDFRQMINPSG